MTQGQPGLSRHPHSKTDPARDRVRVQLSPPTEGREPREAKAGGRQTPHRDPRSREDRRDH